MLWWSIRIKNTRNDQTGMEIGLDKAWIVVNGLFDESGGVAGATFRATVETDRKTGKEED